MRSVPGCTGREHLAELGADGAALDGRAAAHAEREGQRARERGSPLRSRRCTAKGRGGGPHVLSPGSAEGGRRGTLLGPLARDAGARPVDLMRCRAAGQRLGVHGVPHAAALARAGTLAQPGDEAGRGGVRGEFTAMPPDLARGTARCCCSSACCSGSWRSPGQAGAGAPQAEAGSSGSSTTKVAPGPAGSRPRSARVGLDDLPADVEPEPSPLTSLRGPPARTGRRCAPDPPARRPRLRRAPSPPPASRRG